MVFLESGIPGKRKCNTGVRCEALNSGSNSEDGKKGAIFFFPSSLWKIVTFKALWPTQCYSEINGKTNSFTNVSSYLSVWAMLCWILKQGSSTSALLTFWKNKIICWEGREACPLHCGVCSSIPVLCSLEKSNTIPC